MSPVLAKLTSKNQLTLPKSVTEALGPVQYFEVQATKTGQILLTPVRIQRGDAVRAKLAELAIDETALAQALNWSQPAAPAKARKASLKKPGSGAAATKAAAKKPAARKTRAAAK